LIHLEQQWAENKQTAEGRLLHERSDAPGAGRRRGVRTVTAMPLVSTSLGIIGKADVVEFLEAGERPVAHPVEYKRGRPKAHRADDVQLCAQGLCLESMLGMTIAAGALFYGESKRRKEVAFDSELRELTKRIIQETRAMLEARRMPSAQYNPKRCDACSLIGICQPKLLSRKMDVSGWLKEQLEASD
jgi:CRISPR-associated exonuclease Cas4